MPARPTDQRIPLAIVALAVVLGLELLRVYFPLVAFYLRDIAGVGIYGVIPWALGPFVAALAAPLLPRLAGSAGSTLFAGGGLIAGRLLEQISVNSAFDTAASLVGVTFFWWLLASLLLRTGRLFPVGVLLGLAVDTAAKGATTTLDLSWINATWPLILVTFAVVALGFLLYEWEPDQGDEATWTARSALPLVGVGGWLFLQMLILQNQGWLGSATGWPAWATLSWIAVGNCAALALAVRLPSRKAPVATAGLVLLGVALLSGTSGWLLALTTLLGLAMGGIWLPGVTTSFEPSEPGARTAPAAFSLGGGSILFVALALLYYLPLQLELPLTYSQVIIGAGVLVAAAGLLAGRPVPVTPATFEPVAVALVAAIVAVAVHVASLNRTGTHLSGYPVTIMTYNIAQGINTSGRVDPAGIVAELAPTDVAAIQEISRGWLITGGTDLLAWLDARLPHPDSAWAWAEDGGNATFSRYPIASTSSDRLPTVGTLLERSYLETVIGIAAAEHLTVINTHLQNNSRDDLPDGEAEAELLPVHEAQIAIIRDAWGGRVRTVILGDTNARPHWRQTEMILELGFEDAWTGEGPGYTTEIEGVPQRIDWIFHTPDLRSTQAVVIRTGASLDHLPVVAVLEPAIEGVPEKSDDE